MQIQYIKVTRGHDIRNSVLLTLQCHLKLRVVKDTVKVLAHAQYADIYAKLKFKLKIL